MNTNKLSPSTLARFAGALYLLIAVSGIFAHFVTPAQFIVPGDAAATVANIAASEPMFRLGTVGSELIILLSEIVLSVIVYLLLKPVNKTLSIVAAVFRLAMTTIHALNLLNYYFVFELLNSENFTAVFNPEQISALVGLFLNAHDLGFTLGIAFFMPHVLILGYLIYHATYFPKLLGIFFMLAGVGYLVDTIGLLLVSSYTTTPGFIAIIIAVAEVAFPIWLVVKGVNREQWQKRELMLEMA